MSSELWAAGRMARPRIAVGERRTDAPIDGGIRKRDRAEWVRGSRRVASGVDGKSGHQCLNRR